MQVRYGQVLQGSPDVGLVEQVSFVGDIFGKGGVVAAALFRPMIGHRAARRLDRRGAAIMAVVPVLGHLVNRARCAAAAVEKHNVAVLRSSQHRPGLQGWALAAVRTPFLLACLLTKCQSQAAQ